jgi:surfactin synthase thioesterase subunit/NADP-dependent 3-hydroxy acid dehydrogenase YdfG/acyl carrier protein
MAKVMFNELTQYKCRYVDLSANPSMEELDQLLEQLLDTESHEQEVALRGVHQYVPRLGVYRENDSHSVEPRGFTASGTYLITGFKGLGFVFVEWMIRQGARNFALVSRSGDVSHDIQEKIEVLKQQGCTFNIFRADAGVYSEIKTVIDQIESSMPALRGVVHAAGLIEARTLTDLNQTELLRILNPKVKGAWNLHLLTMQKSLDCFILFSSASTLIGLSGQGSYVAANAFLDTLANSRQRMGLPGMSINWGVIKDVGMVANKEALEKYARAEGFEPVSMRDAMDVFHAIYDSQHTQIGIVRLHPETMANYYSSLSQTPYFKGLLGKETIVQAKETRLLDKLAAAKSTEERIVMLEDLVTQMVSKIVKTPPSRIKASMTFKGLGIDSLMAIQLRNMLEKNIDMKLSVAMFWAHPSIHEYAMFLANSLAEQLLIKTMEDQSAQAVRSNLDHWFVRHGDSVNAKVRLFCFHDAGGDASLYHSWPEVLGNEIEVVAVEMPGRGKRMKEAAYSDLSVLISDMIPVMLPLLDKPFSFFGHSMGGLVAFEITRALKKTHNIQPRDLFISSTPGLTTYTLREVDHTLHVEELATIFPHLHRDAIADDELHRYLIDLMRGDLRLLGGYRYVETEPINVPITVIHGDADERVRSDQALAWKKETSSNFTVITRPGGHRYIDHDRAFLGNLLRKTCLNTQAVSIAL